MQNVRACLLILCGVVSSGGCFVGSINGSGKVTTETRPVAGISAVTLSGIGQVIIEQTGTDSLTITTDDNLLPHIKSEMSGNRLELGLKESFTNVNPTNDIIFKVTVKQLEGLEISGSGKAEATKLNPERLSVEISGSGAVAVQGTAGDLNLEISGSGAFDGELLRSKNANVAIIAKVSRPIAASSCTCCGVRRADPRFTKTPPIKANRTNTPTAIGSNSLSTVVASFIVAVLGSVKDDATVRSWPNSVVGEWLR